MVRYAMLVQYTEIGISQIHKTTDRANDFRVTAQKMGVEVEELFWTLGEYDGLVILRCVDEEKIIALITHLARRGYVRTQMLRAYSEHEFASILEKMPVQGVDLDG